MMNQCRRCRAHPLGLVVALLALLVAAVSLAAAQEPVLVAPANVPGGVEGVVYEPDGTTLVEGAWIDVRDEAGQWWPGTRTNAAGSYVVPNLPPGRYTVRAFPPGGSPFAGSLPQTREVQWDTFVWAELRLTGISLGGIVRDCAAVPVIPVADATVVAYDSNLTVKQWDKTGVNGVFKIGGLNASTAYSVEVLPPPGSPYPHLGPISVTPVITNLSLGLCLPPTNVVGIVHDYLGNPQANAQVTARRDDYWDETMTDDQGKFAFHGLPPDPLRPYDVQAVPAAGAPGLLASPPQPAIVSTTSSLVDLGILVLPQATKLVTGHVVYEGTPTGVSGAFVTAYRLDGASYARTTSNANGLFSLGLSPGQWQLYAEPQDAAVDWIATDRPLPITFAANGLPETQAVVIAVVRAAAKVQGHIDCDGATCPGSLAPGQVWVEVSNERYHNAAQPDVQWRFNIPIPEGWYELVVYVNKADYQPPKPQPIAVPPAGIIDAGTISLLPRGARIEGHVYDELGQAVGQVDVRGWEMGSNSWTWARTNTAGFYSLPVQGGNWFVAPAPTEDQPYTYPHDPALVAAPAAGTVAGIDFGLTGVNARVRGVAVDAQTHERLWGLTGRAWAYQLLPTSSTSRFFAAAPLANGTFGLKLQGGYSYSLGLDLPPQAPYASGLAGSAWVNAGDDLTITVPVAAKDAAIVGHLVTPAGQRMEPQALGTVFAYDQQGHWANAIVDMTDGSYHLDVVSGTWGLRAWVDPAIGYVAAPQPVSVVVQAGQAVTQDLRVWPINAIIAGRVQAPDGSPVHAFVYAQGDSPGAGHYETHAESGTDGTFSLVVPAGVYAVGAVLPGDALGANGWLNPPPQQDVRTAPASPATGLTFRFRPADGRIGGVISLGGARTIGPNHPAYVWAWSEAGDWAETQAPVLAGDVFSYSLAVVSGTVWHVGALYEDWNGGVYYKSDEAIVAVRPPNLDVALPLTLLGPYPQAQPGVLTFDAGEMQSIALPGDVELTVPAGALAEAGSMTLYLLATQQLRPDARHTFVGSGYEMWAVDETGQEIGQFKKNVVITFHYPADDVLAGLGIAEQDLIPVYYSTVLDRWVAAEGFSLDTDNNVVHMEVDHFTKWGICSTSPVGLAIYLPVVLKAGP